VTNAVTGSAADTYRLISVKASYSWSDKATIDDAATFGLAHSDYDAAEIEECLEASTSIDLGDKIAQERANRLVRTIGTITGDSNVANQGNNFAGGRLVKTRLNWLMSIGDTLTLWIRNSSGNVYTTGSAITMAGDFWIKDGG